MDVTWDYTELASHYDKRADYSAKALDRLCATIGVGKGAAVADIGAGTGKLAVPLARRGFRVSAVEPNAAMRAFRRPQLRGFGSCLDRGHGRTHQASIRRVRSRDVRIVVQRGGPGHGARGSCAAP